MKIPDNQISNVKVDQESISVSRSGKLLGIVVNNTPDWSNQLYGDDNNKGLIRTLNQHIGLLPVASLQLLARSNLDNALPRLGPSTSAL